jgi:hypothetical protein
MPPWALDTYPTLYYLRVRAFVRTPMAHGIHHRRGSAHALASAYLTVLLVYYLLVRPIRAANPRASVRTTSGRGSLAPVFFRIARPGLSLAPLTAGQGFSVPLDAAAKC